jgi:transcription elongation GreA/GreB family factor
MTEGREAFEANALQDALDRKARIQNLIETKQEALRFLKLREDRSTDEERQMARQIETELRQLSAELKEAETDADKFSPTR